MSLWFREAGAEYNVLILDEKKNERYWYRLQTLVFEKKLADFFIFFRKYGIEPILIKGWAVARFYSGSRVRAYTDIDLCVEESLFEKALGLLQENRENNLNIDIHKGFKTLDTLFWEDLYRNSLTIEKEGVPIRVLRPEDQLRVSCVHWLTDGGENRDKLWDIYFLVKNRPEDFDWERCLGTVSRTRRRWIICTVGLAHKYLGLELDSLPFAAEAKNLPVWLTRTLEKEWNNPVRLIPLRLCRTDPGLFIQQIKKRIPPNPIQATVDLEGEFDDGTRVFYQIRDFLQRTGKYFGRSF